MTVYSYNNVSIKDAHKIIEDASSIIIDVRDETSYTQTRIPRAIPFGEKVIFKLRKIKKSNLTL